MIKTTGAEFKRFYNDDGFWPQDDGNTYHEDETVTVDGAEWEPDYNELPADAKVTLEGGMMFGPQWNRHDGPSMEGYFKKWRKQQSTTFLTVEVPKDKLEAVKAAIKASGGKV